MTCETCRSWNRVAEPDQPGFGVCGKIHEDSGLCGDRPYVRLGKEETVQLTVGGLNGGGFDLWTPKDFSCSLWESR